LLLVESPAKAKTIANILSNLPDHSEYKNCSVIASFGHLFQLKSQQGSITKNDSGTYDFAWEKDKKKADYVLGLAKGKSIIFLASDQDREGEAIAWHLQNLILPSNKNCTIKRITFTEITNTAIVNALNTPRDIDIDLVNSYIVRIASDYWLGFFLSPDLWNNIVHFKNLSAGRVQSPALKLITLREFECFHFVSQNYYSLVVQLNKNLEVKLFIINGQKLSDKVFDRSTLENIQLNKSSKFIVKEIQSKIIKLSTPAPFITSTLQQAAHQKYNMKVKDVMQIAQQLYEGVKIQDQNIGLITYMRTDSTNMSASALEKCREVIANKYSEYLPKEPNYYTTKVKNAQEAHECIRPANFDITPESIKSYLSTEQYNIYKIIWENTIASQMKPAKKSQTTIIFTCDNNEYKMTQSYITYKGFMAVTHLEDIESLSIPVEENEELNYISSIIKEHTTSPPDKYTEASLVASLEKEGIGRPSTYASIIETLKNREYIFVSGKHLRPTFKGMYVSLYLNQFYPEYVDFQFTAQHENKLDKIANQEINHIEVMNQFLDNLKNTIANKKNITKYEVLGLIGPIISEKMNKKCINCNKYLKLALKYSFFFVCEDCKLTVKAEEDIVQVIDSDNKIRINVTSKGAYIEHDNRYITLPKKIPTNLSSEQINLILQLPLDLGLYNDLKIVFDVGKYGFYLKYNGKNIPILKLENAFDMNLQKAIYIIDQYYKKSSNSSNNT